MLPTMAEDILAFVMAGGVGGRLRPLTDARAKPAVPFGGVYRIIDFPLSNCINSDIRQVYVLTQYKSHSLSRHLKSGWNFLSRRLDQFIDEIPAQMQRGRHWYEGTADAIRQNMHLVNAMHPRHVLVLPGDHIYKMDYRFMRDFHQDRGAILTIAALRVEADQARGRYGVMEVDGHGRIVGFEEKPQEPKTLPNSTQCLASMGVYLFDTNVLTEVIDNEMNDLSQQLIPRMVASGKAVYAYDFAMHNRIEEFEYSTQGGRRIRRMVPQSSDAGYWRDVGTIEALWGANLDLVAPHPSFNLYGEKWPIFNDSPHFPPAKFVHEAPDRTGQAHNSIVADGVILSGCLARNSILSPGTYVHSYSLIENSILFGGSISGGRVSETVIGRGCRIRNAIIDKNVQLSTGMVLGYDRNDDAARGFSVHPIGDGNDHVVVVPRGMRI
jgi:glucose-1-phosphate adenylyltransferase